MAELELYGSAACPYTAELREELEWQGRSFSYHDVEEDGAALARMLELTSGGRTVPVLVEAGEVKQIGYGGRGCYIGTGDRSDGGD
jgi:glutaredoxin